MIVPETLEPEAIPLNVKVILIGEASTYYQLQQVDPEFEELFKVKVDFTPHMDRTPDTEKGYASFVAARCEKEGLTNVEIIVGKVMDPLLPAGALDMVFMINVFHHAEDPVALVRNAIPALKPGGTLAIVECDPDKTGWDDHGCTGLEEMPPQLERAGYEMVRVETFLDQDNIFIARPK